MVHRSLCSHFAVERTVFGEVLRTELKPAGSEIAVTQVLRAG
jgi:DNA-binding transcriptional regulator YdaS (Cro superfamily)